MQTIGRPLSRSSFHRHTANGPVSIPARARSRAIFVSPGSDHVKTSRNLLLGDDPISFVEDTNRGRLARHRVLHGCSWRFPFDCGAKTDSRHDQSGNCQSRCKRSAPRLRQVILPEVGLLQLMENSGKEETKTREDRREAAPARVPALVGVAAPSTAGSGGAGDALPMWSNRDP